MHLGRIYGIRVVWRPSSHFSIVTTQGTEVFCSYHTSDGSGGKILVWTCKGLRLLVFWFIWVSISIHFLFFIFLFPSYLVISNTCFSSTKLDIQNLGRGVFNIFPNYSYGNSMIDRYTGLNQLTWLAGIFCYVSYQLWLCRAHTDLVLCMCNYIVGTCTGLYMWDIPPTRPNACMSGAARLNYAHALPCLPYLFPCWWT